MGTSLDGRIITVAGGAGSLGPTVVRRLVDVGDLFGRERTGFARRVPPA